VTLRCDDRASVEPDDPEGYDEQKKGRRATREDSLLEEQREVEAATTRRRDNRPEDVIVLNGARLNVQGIV